jgi:hypothetical protein
MHSEEKQSALPHATRSQDEQEACQDEVKARPIPTASVVYDRKRHIDLMKVVGEEFAKVSCDHLPQAALIETLMTAGFANTEVMQGLERLDGENKILLMDGLVVTVG